MPIYEYLCERCGRITEVIHRMSERGPTECTECGAKEIARVVSRSAFQLKGGGWYADLYSSRKAATTGGDASAGGGASKPASETKSPGESKGAGEAKTAGAASPKPAASGGDKS